MKLFRSRDMDQVQVQESTLPAGSSSSFITRSKEIDQFENIDFPELVKSLEHQYSKYSLKIKLEKKSKRWRFDFSYWSPRTGSKAHQNRYRHFLSKFRFQNEHWAWRKKNNDIETLRKDHLEKNLSRCRQVVKMFTETSSAELLMFASKFLSRLERGGLLLLGNRIEMLL